MRVPLDSDPDHHGVRLQRLEHPELADPELHAPLVPGRLGRPGGAQLALALAQGRRSSRPAIALVLGTAAVVCDLRASASSAARRSRSCSCCRSRCPGVITGMALNSFYTFAGVLVLDLDDRDRPRDLLRGRRLQQRARAAAAHLAVARRGVDGPRGRRLADLPLRDLARCSRPRSSPAALLAFALSFDEVIVTIFTAGAQNDAADLHPRQHPARPAAARRERGRVRGHRADGDPGGDLAAPDARVRTAQQPVAR